MKTIVYASAAAAVLLQSVVGAPNARPLRLRDVAKPRFFGAAANTTFLFSDKKYTDVISTQVRPRAAERPPTGTHAFASSPSSRLRMRVRGLGQFAGVDC